MPVTATATYRVALIGLGRIAASYGRPEDPGAYCHAAGILGCERTVLTAAVDPAPTARETFAGRWGAALGEPRLLAAVDQLAALGPLDVVAVCVRGPHHLAVVREVLALRPRHLFLEKPPACSLVEHDELVALAAAAGVPVTVSYSRRWAPVNQHCARLLRQGLLGRIRSVTCHADPALLSAACHGLDALVQFTGARPLAVTATGAAGTATVPAGYEPEPSLRSAMVEFDSGAVGVIHGGAGEHGVFYVDVVGERGHLRCGMYTPTVATVDGRRLSVEELAVPAPCSPFRVAYDQIARHLDGGPAPDAIDAAWHPVDELAFAAVDSIHRGERVQVGAADRARRVYANG